VSAKLRAKALPKGIALNRTYLYVPFEDSERVRSLGAHRDAERMCWYLEPGQDPAPFSRWLGEDESDEGFLIASDAAFVAASRVRCWHCDTQTQVICIFCDSGVVSGEPLEQFTVSQIWKVDDALREQLGRWPDFRPVASGDCFANHCQHCGAVQDDMELHTEPDHPFFNIPRDASGEIQLTPVIGLVQLSGSESFEI
jgi:hypothetical protein